MNLKLEQLEAHLKAGKFAPLYVVHGDEHLLALEASDRIRRALRAAGYAERDVLHAERRFDWNRLTASSQSLSLFGDRKLLEVRIPSGKPGRDGSAALQDFASTCTPASANDLIALVTLPKLERDGLQSPWFGALGRAGVLIEAALVTRARLPAWIGVRLAAQNQQADNATLEFIADRVEGNLLAADQEIRKLGLLYSPGSLDADAVRMAVLDASRYDPYKLRDALIEGNSARYARILQGLQGEGAALPLVIWAIADGLRRAIANETSAIRRKRLGRALRETARADRVAKGLRPRGSSGNAWHELLMLTLTLHGEAPLASR